MNLSSLFIFICVLLTSTSSCDGLRAEYIDAILPAAKIQISAVYDGDDSIYLFGGYGIISGWVRDILRFDISTETIRKVGSTSTYMNNGQIQMDANGNFLYFGFNDSGKGVIKFNPVGGSIEEVATLPYSVKSGASVSSSSDTVYLFGGLGKRDGIIKFETGVVPKTLPLEFQSLASVQIKNKAYIFGDKEDSTASQSVMVVDLETLQAEVGPANFPNIKDVHSAVTDGTYAYIIGGFSETFTGVPSNSILSFDPATFEWTSQPVENLMIHGNDTWLDYGPSCVYIEKLHRIYMFGGSESRRPGSGELLYRNQIGYIDLNFPATTPPITTVLPTSTPIPVGFDCSDQPNGFYPHPSECNLFFGCLNGMTESYECSPPLVFDIETRDCDRPELSICGNFCVGKPDVKYEHPRDCSRFILCFNEEVEIHSCPKPLLFDPVTSKCNFPELVNCNSL